MTRLVFKWSSLALALASTGATARDLPNHEVLGDPPPSPRANKQLLPEATDARVAHRDAQRDLPTFVWARKKSEAPPRALLANMKPEQAAREQLGEYLSLYGHESLTESVASVTSVSRDSRGVTIVTFAQQVDGVEVFRQGLKVLLDTNNEVVALSGNLSPHVSATTSAARASSLRHQLTAPQAISLAYRDLTGAPLDGGLLTRANPRADEQDPYTHYQLASYARPLAEGLVIPARARRVFFPMPDRLVPAYYLELHTARAESRESDYYAYVVSAADGRLLLRNNLTAHADFSYRVWAETTPPYVPLDGPSGGVVTPHPTGIPRSISAPPYVAPSLVTLQNAPFSRNDPWLPDGATQTVGNNVDAYADLVAPDGFGTGDYRATVTAPGVFDRSTDFSLQPHANLEQIQAATTQLFYVNNWLHDWFYDVGFDEASGNAQQDNHGRGGLGHDALHAEAQDYDGRNNANMWTPADGAPPIMQMFIYDGPEETLDDQYLEVTAPASVAGKYAVGNANFGPQSFDLSGQVVLAASGDSTTTACEALTNAAEVAGKIAFIDRGGCTFVRKIRNAQSAGAVGVIIANNTSGALEAADTAPDITLPSLYITQADGDKLRATLPDLTTKLHRVLVPDLDGTLDNSIVAHEWGHYISNRLVWNASGLSNNQGKSLGEGWADFTALLMMSRPEDIHVPSNAQWNGAYAVVGYATRGGMSEDSTFFGLRRVPYSADMARNALTFRHIANGEPLPSSASTTPFSTNAEVHNSGEIWATMLWDCYVSLLRAYPFEEAQHRMKQYLVNGYKLTPATPTFLEAREALIAAASAASAEDGRRFWEAFARRGAGVGAVAPDRTSWDHGGVVESYDVTADVTVVSLSVEAVSKTCDRDNILDNGETGLLRIELRNLDAIPTERTSATVTSSTPGVTLGNGGQVQVPALDRLEETEVTLPVSLQGATGRQQLSFTVTTRQEDTSRPGGRQVTQGVWAHYDEKPASTTTEDVESSNPPWTATNDGHRDNVNWTTREYPTATGNHVFHARDVNGPSDMRLTSPPLQVSATEPLVLEFKQAWDFEVGAGMNHDGAVIELSADEGRTWKDVGESLYNGTLASYEDNLNPLDGRRAFVGQSTNFPAFITSRLDLGTAYAGKTVRLRFRVGSNQNTGANGWLLDDLEFNGLTHTPFTTTTAEDGVCVPPPVTNVNRAPTAHGGGLLSVQAGAQAQLDGSRSSDPDGDALTYTWTQVEGTPPVTLSGADTATPSFTAPDVDAQTTLRFSLVVEDGSLSSEPAFVSVTITPKEPPRCGCSTGAEAPLGLMGLALLAVARRRRVSSAPRLLVSLSLPSLRI